jgi:F-type H+-transporting ATPase subunit delta
MSAVALRYAHAFNSVVSSQGIDAAVAQQQLRDFRETFKGSCELREVLMDPALPREQKLKLVDAVASKIGMFPQVRNFLAVIMSNDRLSDLDEILDEYHAVADRQAGLIEAEIVSARPLNNEDRTSLEVQVEKLAGGKVRATYREDSSLLGGAVIRIGSTVYDGSVRAQLLQMKQRLVGA